MLASADHPIGPGLGIGDLTVSARWSIPVWDHRMAIRNQTCVRAEIECAIMPENQRLISSRYCIPRADLAQVGVVNQKTGQAQEKRCPGSQVRGGTRLYRHQFARACTHGSLLMFNGSCSKTRSGSGLLCVSGDIPSKSVIGTQCG